MTKTRLICLAAMATTAIASVAFALNQQSRKPNMPVSPLQSDDWRERAVGVEGLITRGDAFKSNRAKGDLTSLLERENQLIGAAFRDSGGETGLAVEYGEEYAEYYSRLFGAVWTLAADNNDARALKVLARGSYNPNSQFAMWLSGHGEAVAPTLLEMTQSDVATERENALSVLGEMSKPERAQVKSETYEQIREALVAAATSDTDIVVRSQAVRSLGTMGDKSALPLLEGIIEESDPEAAPSEGEVETENPVKEEAQKAIRAIRKLEERPTRPDQNIEQEHPIRDQ